MSDHKHSPDPLRNHGYTDLCSCGLRIHHNEDGSWGLDDKDEATCLTSFRVDKYEVYDKDEADARIAELKAENTELRKQGEILSTSRRLEEEARERAEAAVAERDALNEAALHWLVSLKQDYDENGNGIRKWSEVYDECVANIKRLAACVSRAKEGSES